MINFFKKNKFHILVWIVMLIYLNAAYGLYSLFLSKGRPVSFDLESSVKTKQIKYSIDSFNNKASYDILSGWAVLTEEHDQSQYERLIMLQSDTKTYFFPLTSTKRPDLQKIFKKSKIDVQKAGFNAHISSNFIQPGSYLIGIVFRLKTSNVSYYIVTDRLILRTPNHFQLKAIPQN